MNRPIKFRAWYLNQMWEVLNLNFFTGGIETELQRPNGTGFSHANTSSTDDVRLMQFTGLLDKNGKDIYEGDVIKCEVEEPFQRVHGTFSHKEIIYRNGMWVASYLSSEKGRIM